MNIKLICVGQLKEKYLKEACQEYGKRLSRYARIHTIEISEEDERNPGFLKKEGEQILRHLDSGDYVVTLEIRGETMDSEEFSGVLGQLMLQGNSRLALIIGGSHGLNGEVSGRADLRLSFSRMTFPHQLMRLILLEQLYRAFKILRNETYHK